MKVVPFLIAGVLIASVNAAGYAVYQEIAHSNPVESVPASMGKVAEPRLEERSFSQEEPSDRGLAEAVPSESRKTSAAASSTDGGADQHRVDTKATQRVEAEKTQASRRSAHRSRKAAKERQRRKRAQRRSKPAETVAAPKTAPLDSTPPQPSQPELKSRPAKSSLIEVEENPYKQQN